jgi:MYXO-CTERM domain-containing protein
MRRSTLCLALTAFFALSLGPLGPSSALGAGGGGAGGGSSSSSSSSSSATSSSASSSSTGMASCMADGVCEALTEDCTCADCQMLAMCVPDQCVNDGLCDLLDACICVDCRQDQFCSNPAHCKNDGKCDSFTEGCQCEDCAHKAECPISSSSSTGVSSSGSTGGAGGSASGASGTGGSPDSGDQGCSTRPGGQGPLIPLGVGLLLAGAALLGRRRGD